MHDPEIEAVLDLDIPDPSGGIERHGLAIIIKNPPNALDQPFERRPIKPIGTPEAVHHLGFDIALLGKRIDLTVEPSLFRRLVILRYMPTD